MKTLWLVVILCGAVLANANHCSGFGYEIIVEILETIQTDIQVVKSDVNAIQKIVNQLKEDQDELKGEFTGHKTATNSKIDQLIKTDVPAIQTKVDKLNEEFINYKKTLKSTNNQLVDAIVTELKSNHGKLNSTIHSKVDELNSGQEKLKKALSDHKTAINLKINQMNEELIAHKRTFNSTVDQLMQEIVTESTCPKNGGNGEYALKLYSNRGSSVYCDEGWIVIQRRFDGSLSFNRNWAEYRNGFGTLQGEYWMGLERMHQITRAGSYELLVVMKDWKGQEMRAKYKTFKIASEAEKYRLHLGYFIEGDVEDYFYSNRAKFTTPDRDNDDNVGYNCAEKYKSGWWFTVCGYVDLNAIRGKGLNGFRWNHLELSESRMMIRAAK